MWRAQQKELDPDDNGNRTTRYGVAFQQIPRCRHWNICSAAMGGPRWYPSRLILSIQPEEGILMGFQASLGPKETHAPLSRDEHAWRPIA